MQGIPVLLEQIRIKLDEENGITVIGDSAVIVTSGSAIGTVKALELGGGEDLE